MEKVLVDTFIVPEESKVKFVELANEAQQFIRTLPGFVEGYIYERNNGESQYNFMTTAVWESEAAFENATKRVAAEFQRRGFNPQENAKRLGVQRVRSTYGRAPY